MGATPGRRKACVVWENREGGSDSTGRDAPFSSFGPQIVAKSVKNLSRRVVARRTDAGPRRNRSQGGVTATNGRLNSTSLRARNEPPEHHPEDLRDPTTKSLLRGKKTRFAPPFSPAARRESTLAETIRLGLVVRALARPNELNAIGSALGLSSRQHGLPAACPCPKKPAPAPQHDAQRSTPPGSTHNIQTHKRMGKS